MQGYKETFEGLYKEIGKIVIGQRDVIEQVLRLHNKWMDSEAFTW